MSREDQDANVARQALEQVSYCEQQQARRSSLRLCEGDQPSRGDSLWDANPTCEHVIIDAPGGGIKCALCPGWFCF